MARLPHPEMVRLTARVPRGQDGFWAIIRDLDTRGPWSVLDVEGRSNVRHRETVHDFVGRLTRGGFARCVSEVPTERSGTPTKFYRLLKRPADTPSLRRDGTLLPVPAQQRMWNAIRSMKQFRLPDLAFAAGDESGAIATTTVKRYIHHLATAGYLAVLSPGEFRFKRSMDTGPRAPKVLRMHVVWDANRNEVVGDEVDAEDTP